MLNFEKVFDIKVGKHGLVSIWLLTEVDDIFKVSLSEWKNSLDVIVAFLGQQLDIIGFVLVKFSLDRVKIFKNLLMG